MSETANLKLISPDASSVLIPLHSHFAVLASGVDEAITNRFQYKILAYETTGDRDAAYTELTGIPVEANSNKPNLADGDVCYIRANKRYYIWNVNASGTNSWVQTLKRFTFTNAANRDLMLPEDIAAGDTCYVVDSGLDFVWEGSAWRPVTSAIMPKTIVASAFYGPAVFGTSQGQQLNDRIYYTPFYVPTRGTYDAYNVHVVTAGTSSTITIGLYNSSPLTGLPTSLVSGSTSASTATNTTGAAPTPTLSPGVILQPGWYWIGTFVDGSVMPVIVSTAVGATGGGGWWMPRTNAYNGANLNSPELYDTTYTSNTPGVMPANAGGIAHGSGTRSPIIAVRKSA
jgi:hypothetical protein